MKYGFSREKGISLVRKGKSGAEEIIALMKQFRENPPKEIAGSPVVTVKDFQSLVETNVATGETKKLDMPATSNVLQYYTADRTKVSVRPSGTEPKIKFYIEVHDTLASADEYKATEARASRKNSASLSKNSLIFIINNGLRMCATHYFFACYIIIRHTDALLICMNFKQYCLCRKTLLI